MKNFWPLPLAVLLIGGLTACPSPTIYHTAKPIAAGQNEITIAPNLAGFIFPDVETGAGTVDGLNITAPGAGVAFRHGIDESMDFGIKWSTSNPISLTADLNFALLNTGSLVLSIDPTITPVYFSAGDASTFMLWVTVPVLFDILSTDATALTVGLVPGIIYGSVSGASGDDRVSVDGFEYGGGAMVGFKARLGETFSMMPTGTIMYWMDSEWITYTIGLGFMF